MREYKYRKTFTHEGKRYTVRADTQKELYRKLAQKQLALEQGAVLVSETMLVKDWAWRAFETYKNDLSPSTHKIYEYRIKKICSLIGNMKLKDVRPIHCQEIINGFADMSQSTIDVHLQALYFIFETAKDNKLVRENPAAKLARPKGTKEKRRAITDYERKHVLAVCAKDDCYILFLLMLYCGCRSAEAAKAIGKDLIKIDGVNFLQIRGTKSANAVRKVPIPDELYERIKDTKPFDPISPNRHGNIHSESSYKRLREHFYRDLNISMGCKVYRNALVPPLPLAEDFVPYDLRHTYCTDLCKRGVDIRTAQYLMGHSDISLTANIYTHVDNEAILSAAEKLKGIV